ncbi:D-lactaldehyde dehydrogenase [Calocera cornea HHB12733]|uniref:D-lactaldehyde dehydrogenase n=1 Tax=Calocera cornea HHB12733 TaxID=1353952 RepID=A0A165ES96_9BASI|nr:D-lactaldehyde dehydrogenase [Calocera cornea HHB12733]
MTVVNAPSKVLLTGANGFIAVWILRYLLEAGYSVRGTVRSASKGDYLKRKFAQYGDKLEIEEVADITAPGAFDKSVVGVDAVLHTASPVTFTGTYDGEPQAVVVPAIEATKTLLESVLKHGTSVKRVIVTSSVVALMQPHGNSYTYTDKDWNEYAIDEVTKNKEGAPAYLFYFAAKALAEKEAWLFYGLHKREIKWDLTTILPPYVFGPLIHETDVAQTNGKPQSFLYGNLMQERDAKALGNEGGAWIDVRDTATGHVRALQVAEASEERLIISAGTFFWQDVLDTVASVEPKIEGIPRGVPGVERGSASGPDSSKANRILGLKYISLAESVADAIKTVRELSA